MKKILIILFLLFGMAQGAIAGITFDGSNGLVDVGTMGSFGTNLNTNHLIVSFWFKSSTTGTAIAPYGQVQTGTSMLEQLFFNVQSDGATVSAGRCFAQRRWTSGSSAQGGVNTATGMMDGKWHNFIIDMDAADTTSKVYVDGVSQSWTAGGASSSGATNFDFHMYIGARNTRGTADHLFNGTITEIAMWASSVGISTSDVTILNTKTRGNPLSGSLGINGLNGYWKMNDGTSGSANSATVKDSSGGSNTGTASSSGNTWTNDCDLFSCGGRILNNFVIKNAVLN